MGKDTSSKGHIADVIERVFHNHKLEGFVAINENGVIQYEDCDGVWVGQFVLELLDEVVLDLSLCTKEQLQRIDEYADATYNKTYFDDILDADKEE